MRRLSLLIIFLLSLVNSHAQAQVLQRAGTPTVFIQTRLRDATLDENTLTQRLGAITLYNTVATQTDAQYLIQITDTRADPVLGTTYNITITYQHPMVVLYGPNNVADKNNYGGAFTVDSSIDATQRYQLISDSVQAVFESWYHPSTIDPPTASGGDHWYIDVSLDGRYYSKGTDYKNTNLGIGNHIEASYPTYKVVFQTNGSYTFLKQFNSTSGVNDQESAIVINNTDQYAYKIGNHYSAIGLYSITHDPKGQNLKLGNVVGVAGEWLLRRYRTPDHPTNISGQVGLTVNGNDYQVITMFGKLHEIFAAANARLIFNWYSRDQKINVRLSGAVSVPFDSIKFSMLQGSASLNYKISKVLTFKVSGNAVYRPESRYNPDPSIPAPPLQSVFYNSVTGFAQSYNISIFFVPKFSTKKDTDMTITGP